MEVNRIYNEDCLLTMWAMKDKYVDLTLTDFPYGNNENYDTYSDTKENLISLVNKVMPEILRVSKVALICCGVENIWYYPHPDWILNWYCPAGAGSGKWGFCTWQPILAYGQDPYLTNGLGRQPDTIKTNETSESNGHPCPKPKKLWAKLLHRGSIHEGDLIYDPFIGSGTTAITAIHYKRNFIGSEISPAYCSIANQSISNYLNQPKLF